MKLCVSHKDQETHSQLVSRAAVIVEATYGVSRHLPREGREQRFVNMIRSVVQRGGRCLLPVVALGRAQVQKESLK